MSSCNSRVQELGNLLTLGKARFEVTFTVSVQRLGMFLPPFDFALAVGGAFFTGVHNSNGIAKFGEEDENSKIALTA